MAWTTRSLEFTSTVSDLELECDRISKGARCRPSSGKVVERRVTDLRIDRKGWVQHEDAEKGESRFAGSDPSS